jgi:hypothetical protein
MRKHCILFALALHFAPVAMSADASDAGDYSRKKSSAPGQIQQTPTAIPADPIADLFLGAGGSAGTPPPRVAGTQPPTYESWDVLRQYPRYEALPLPSVPEPKAQGSKKVTKEKVDD